MKTVKITKPKVKKLIKTVQAGLCSGLGEPEPGNMCVEAAVCYALGLPHGDNPICISPVLRRFKISLNDAKWSTNQARAKGLLRLAVLQLGTDTNFDDVKFISEIVIRLVREIISELPNLPVEVREQCRDVDSLAAAKAAVANATANATADVKAAAYGADDAADSYATAVATAYAAAVAYIAAADAKVTAHAAAAVYAADADNVKAAAIHVAEAVAAVYAADADKVLSKMAKIAEEVLITMNVPAVKYLDLLEVDDE